MTNSTGACHDKMVWADVQKVGHFRGDVIEDSINTLSSMHYGADIGVDIWRKRIDRWSGYGSQRRRRCVGRIWGRISSPFRFRSSRCVRRGALGSLMKATVVLPYDAQTSNLVTVWSWTQVRLSRQSFEYDSIV